MSDPDYEAQFTRGYTGPPIVPPVSRAERAEVAAPAADAASGGETGEPVAPIETAEVDEPAPQQEADPAYAQPRRNPWSIALLVASVAMVATGWSLLRLYATTNANGYALADQTAVLLLQSNVGAALMTAGIVGVIAWLALIALRGSARRGSP